jgi:hypothetical protein
MEKWRQGDIKQKMENRSPGDFPYSVYRLLIVKNGNLSFVCLLTKKQTEVIYLQTE